MTSVLLPGLALIVLFGLISGRSTGTRLFAFSWLRRKIWVRTWSPRRTGVADRDGAGLQLGVGLGHDLEEAADLDHGEAEAAQRGEEVEVGLARRQRLLAVERDRAAHARVDDELLAQDRRHRARHALDLGVDEVERDRLRRESAAAVGGAPTGWGSAPAAAASDERQRRRHQPPRRLGQRIVRARSWGHGHPIEMIDRAPSRRPMMLSRFDSAASSTAAERASPRNLTPPGPQVPLPISCSGPSVVDSDSSVALFSPAPPVSVTLVAAERVERRQTRRYGLEVEVDAAVEPPAALDLLDRDARRERGARVPPSCSVFQGVPRPPSQALGHWPTVPAPGGGSRVARMRPRPGRICSISVPLMQQSWRAASSTP